MRRGRRDRASSGREVSTDLENAGCVITALAPHERRAGRIVVIADDRELGALTIDLVADLSVRAGILFDGGRLRDLLTAIRRTALLDKALDLLAVSARSTRDMRVRLRRSGAQAEDIAWVVDRMQVQGFLDDAAYARQVARGKLHSGSMSRRAVESLLRRKGVAADVASEAIRAEVADGATDEHGAALAVARTRLRALRSLDPVVRRRRLYSYMARRGYDASTVREVLREVLSDSVRE